MTHGKKHTTIVMTKGRIAFLLSLTHAKKMIASTSIGSIPGLVRIPKLSTAALRMLFISVGLFHILCHEAKNRANKKTNSVSVRNKPVIKIKGG
ncbi:hypothetical protein D3C77_421200 [compost metagenome]